MNGLWQQREINKERRREGGGEQWRDEEELQMIESFRT